MAKRITREPPIRDDERVRLEAALKHIRRHFAKGTEYNFQDTADAAGMSAYHFHRRFRLCFGFTVKQEATRLQIEKAKELLLKGRSCRAVAKECGFSTESHLTTRFQQIVGEVPTRWRNEQRGES